MSAETMKVRRFPIVQGYGYKGAPFLPSVPWEVAELAYSVYSGRYGTSQSLERLAERGGFHPGEMDEFVPNWRERASVIVELEASLTAAQAELAALKVEFNKALQQQVIADNETDAEIAALRKDAERYRWLREHTDSMSIDPPLTVAQVSGWGLDAWSGDNLDAAIDASKG